MKGARRAERDFAASKVWRALNSSASNYTSWRTGWNVEPAPDDFLGSPVILPTAGNYARQLLRSRWNGKTDVYRAFLPLNIVFCYISDTAVFHCNIYQKLQLRNLLILRSLLFLLPFNDNRTHRLHLITVNPILKILWCTTIVSFHLETYTSGTTPKRNKQINRVPCRTIIVHVWLVLRILMQNLDIVVFNHESTVLRKILLEQALNEENDKDK